ncbi:hypothetical protein [Bacillus sp. NPDC094106]|uniref:hypothetical protein n=1 Tax=Bacillus sp. NPDC094106 TaxID=3363949 RepID=UPI00381756B5
MTQKITITLENKSNHIYDFYYIVEVISYLDSEDVEFIFNSRNSYETDGYKERKVSIQLPLLQRMLRVAKATCNNVSVSVKSDSFNNTNPTEPLNISYDKDRDMFCLGMDNCLDELVFEADILLEVVNSLVSP